MLGARSTNILVYRGSSSLSITYIYHHDIGLDQTGRGERERPPPELGSDARHSSTGYGQCLSIGLEVKISGRFLQSLPPSHRQRAYCLAEPSQEGVVPSQIMRMVGKD